MLQPYSQPLNSLTRLYFKADPKILEANAEAHFSKDSLGYFISHTRQDLLRLAGVPKEKHQDLFMRYAVTTVSKQHESMAARHLTLRRDVPKTLTIVKAPETKKEVQIDEINDDEYTKAVFC